MIEMSQQELARRLGVSNAHVCDIEYGRRAPSDSLAERIDALLHIGLPDNRYTELEAAIRWYGVEPDDLLRDYRLAQGVDVEEQR
jgi:transcriptional regulator with XRE-family HTH domain